ncbi:Predicted membrane protein [Blastococcus tunisiensis]|uniref:Predicted membrane protein n=1 Tax=Blastococcus tunisiensis TaxID=1798228 RepID=A0A1I1WJ51_9ACTN|nr:Predicted membrane protein [Blastococcus sp. DSM 46838]
MVRFLLVPLLAFLALGAWALASPVGASPDEDFHLSSVWCGQGISEGVCETSSEEGERLIPEPLLHAAGCFAFRSEASAECQSAWFVEESDELSSSGRGNYSGGYPPVFYYVMNVFVGDDISQSVVLMRLVNSALFVGLGTALYWLLPRERRQLLVLGTAVTLVPLGLFIVPSINPSSWAVIAGALVFPAMVGFFQCTGRRRVALGALGAVATLVAAGSRADSAVYAVLAIALAALLALRWTRRAWKLLALPLVLAVACAVSYVTSGQNEAATVGFDGTSGPVTGAAGQLAYNLLNVPELWAGAFGYWNLGWLDTRMPSIVWVVNVVAFGVVVFLGMRRSSRRKIAAFLITLAAAWLIPTYVLVQSSALVGSQVQPRYLLPLLILLAQVALFRTGDERPEFSRAQLWSLAAALSATAAISLHFNMRRYITGTDVFGANLDAGIEWWWAIPVSPMVVWALGSVSFAAALVLWVRSTPADDAPRALGSADGAADDDVSDRDGVGDPPTVPQERYQGERPMVAASAGSYRPA